VKIPKDIFTEQGILILSPQGVTMKPDKVYVPLLVLITLLVCFSLLEYGFWSIDEESYEFLTRSIVKKGQLHFESDYSEIQSDLSRAYFGVVSNNKVYSVFFPPGTLSSQPPSISSGVSRECKLPTSSSQFLSY
jgi:hypothetical protein